ncbi:DUF4235 domain-containing protein [Bifidobacterium callimiconis]|uniref:DUF4235 domain-containing protein n=1 Tax=Bifidobacterium callimiconis TaxID=2306973 RepID=UPI001BDCF696|nr:DUF4235 domain-containing protein [Bifidobacterium callimiconis]MBT1177773.1 DUF4235 domain-containing protein [Bifidobacterium callimiconis]
MTDSHTSPNSNVDQIVDAFGRFDAKVDAMRERRLNDPDSLGDKLLKFALPSVAGFVASKAFQLLWNNTVSSRSVKRSGRHTSKSDVSRETITDSNSLGDGIVDERESLFMSIAFSALSAALSAVVSQLSDRGSQALVTRRHNRRTR